MTTRLTVSMQCVVPYDWLYRRWISESAWLCALVARVALSLTLTTVLVLIMLTMFVVTRCNAPMWMNGPVMSSTTHARHQGTPHSTRTGTKTTHRKQGGTTRHRGYQWNTARRARVHDSPTAKTGIKHRDQMVHEHAARH